MLPKKNPAKTSSGCWNLKLERLEFRDVPAVLAADDSFVANESQLLEVSAPGVLTNDSSTVPDRVLTAQLVGAPIPGLNFRTDGSFTYNPDADPDGQVSFDYVADDGHGNTDIGSVTINVNVAPVAEPISAVTPVNETVQLFPIASDPDGEVVGYEFEAQNGTVESNEFGEIFFRPESDFVGTAVFNYRAIDNHQLMSKSATVTVEVGGANNAPVAMSDEYSTRFNTSLIVDAPGVLANDVDEDGDSLYAIFNTEPQNGTLTGGPDGSFTYTPNNGFIGTDTFEYLLDDGREAYSYGTVTINVLPANSAPVAHDAAASVREDGTIRGTLHGVDLDGDRLRYSLTSAPTNGRVTVNANGRFTYTPNPNFNGTDTFTFKANDGRQDSNIATVFVDVRPVNDAPTLSGATFTIAENALNGTSVGTIGGADVDGDALTYSIVGGNTRGAFAIDPNTGAIRVANTVALDFETRPTFNLTVRATDAAGRGARATITVRLTDVSEARAIDILPGSDQNRININRRDLVGVAIYSSATFDARTLDVNSLRFGRTGLENSLSLDRRGRPRVEVRDVNGDGRLDLVVQFEVDSTGFQVGDSRGFLTGRLTNGSAFAAEDAVNIRA